MRGFDFPVGHDDLELVAVLDGLEQVELDGGFVLASDLLSDEDEAITSVPRLRFPAGLEVTEPGGHWTPSSSAFDQPFEDGKTLKGHRDGEFDPQGVKSLNDGLVEECTVDTGLRFCSGQARAHVAHTVLNEGIGSVGVVDIPRAMVNIEDLVGLGDGAKEGIVAARTFFSSC